MRNHKLSWYYRRREKDMLTYCRGNCPDLQETMESNDKGSYDKICCRRNYINPANPVHINAGVRLCPKSEYYRLSPMQLLQATKDYIRLQQGLTEAEEERKRLIAKSKPAPKAITGRKRVRGNNDEYETIVDEGQRKQKDLTDDIFSPVKKD